MPVQIKSMVDGFRRVGVAHSVEPKYYADQYFSEAQLVQLRSERRLAVNLVEEVPEGETVVRATSQGAVDSSGVAVSLTGVVDDDGEKPLDQLNKTQLKSLAKDLEIKGYTAMDSDALIKAIKEARIDLTDAESTE